MDVDRQVVVAGGETVAICCGVTARREWKHRPRGVACRLQRRAQALEQFQASLPLMKRRWPSLAGWPPKPA